MSGLTGQEITTQFRRIGGFNTTNPTSQVIIDHFNNIRQGAIVSAGDIAICPLIDLFPALAGELGSLVSSQDIDLLNDTNSYSITPFTKLAKASVKFSSSDDYTPVRPERILFDRLDEYDKLAQAASCDNPVLAIYDDTLYVYPTPGEGVTAGVKLDVLTLPTADITTSQAAIEEGKRICLVEVKAAIAEYYGAFEGKSNEMATWLLRAANDIRLLVKHSAGRAAPQTLIFGGGGNLSKFLD